MGVYITIFVFPSLSLSQCLFKKTIFDLLSLLRKIKPATYLPTYLPTVGDLGQKFEFHF